MRIIPFEIEIEKWDTLEIDILHFDGVNLDARLFQLGVWCGMFQFDLFFYKFLKYKYIEWKESKLQ